MEKPQGLDTPEWLAILPSLPQFSQAFHMVFRTSAPISSSPGWDIDSHLLEPACVCNRALLPLDPPESGITAHKSVDPPRQCWGSRIAVTRLVAMSFVGIEVSFLVESGHLGVGEPWVSGDTGKKLGLEEFCFEADLSAQLL